MAQRIKLGDIAVEVVFKDIKNIHLSVNPPDGAVRISAPARMSLDTLRVFAISRLAWIKRQRARLREQERETPREYLDRESHYLWGRRHLLTLIEADAAPSLELEHDRLLLRLRPGSDEVKKQAVVARWYRERIKAAAPPLIAHWEALLGVKLERFFVRGMKTRWGSCHPGKRHIRLNTELAKKPRVCLEYIVAHEMAHLVEPTHNARFIALLDRHMPNWRAHRDQLNQLPLRHEAWRY